MLQFLHSIPHDLLVVALTLLAIVWCLGVRWCWGFLGNGILKHPTLRGPISLFIWPMWLALALIVARIGIVQAILAACLLGAVLMHPGPALAGDLVARQGNDSVRLTDQPCPIMDIIANSVPEGRRGYLRLARAEFGGQQFTACWVPWGPVVRIFYEDQDQGVIPVEDIKPALDI